MFSFLTFITAPYRVNSLNKYEFFTDFNINNSKVLFLADQKEEVVAHQQAYHWHGGPLTIKVFLERADNMYFKIHFQEVAPITRDNVIFNGVPSLPIAMPGAKPNELWFGARDVTVKKGWNELTLSSASPRTPAVIERISAMNVMGYTDFLLETKLIDRQISAVAPAPYFSLNALFQVTASLLLFWLFLSCLSFLSGFVIVDPGTAFVPANTFLATVYLLFLSLPVIPAVSQFQVYVSENSFFTITIGSVILSFMFYLYRNFSPTEKFLKSLSSLRTKILKVPAVTVIVIPIVMYFVLLQRYGLNLLYRDQWSQFIDVISLKEGYLRFEDLFILHNENRMTLARIIWLINSYLTNYNIKVHMYLSAMFISGSAWIIFRAQMREFASLARNTRLFCFVPMAFLLFHLYQWEVMFRADEMVRVLGNFLFVMLTYFICFEKANFFLWVTIGVLCALCQISGLLVWPVFFLVFLAKRKWNLSAWWSLGGIITIFVYTINWHPPAAQKAYLSPFGVPIKAITYFFSVLGNPFLVIAPAFTGVLTVFVLFFLWRYRRFFEGNNLFIQFNLTLILTGFFEAAMITSGRLYMGGVNASRYAHEMVYFWVGVVNLVLVLLLQIRARPIPPRQVFKVASMVILFLYGFFNNYIAGFAKIISHNQELTAQSRHLDFYLYTPAMYVDFFSAEILKVRRYASKMERYGMLCGRSQQDWYRYSDSGLNDSRLSGVFGIVDTAEVISNQLSLDKEDSVLFLEGWVLSKKEFLKIKTVALVANDQIIVEVKPGPLRPDLKDYFVDSENVYHDWLMYVPVNKLSGNSHVKIVARFSDGKFGELATTDKVRGFESNFTLLSADLAATSEKDRWLWKERLKIPGRQ